MKSNRYYRFFREDDKALVLAFDHGGGGDSWVNPADVIKGAVAGGIDGILTTCGVISNFRKEIGKVGTMMRMDVLGSSLSKGDVINGKPMGSPYTVEDCLYLGVDGIMTMGIIANDFDTENLRYIARLSADCKKYGLVSAAEMLPNGFAPKPEDRSLKSMNIACRVAAEIGVDIVKTTVIEPIEDFKKIVDNCYVDILALGGAKLADDRQVLVNAQAAMNAGCKGLMIGRNIWAHSNPEGMARALSMIVHDEGSVDDALKAM